MGSNAVLPNHHGAFSECPCSSAAAYIDASPQEETHDVDQHERKMKLYAMIGCCCSNRPELCSDSNCSSPPCFAAPYLERQRLTCMRARRDLGRSSLCSISKPFHVEIESHADAVPAAARAAATTSALIVGHVPQKRFLKRCRRPNIWFGWLII